MAPERIVIRKYENRRLYDTASSRYVNLEEVARLVRSGHELQVLDARTGEDVTRLVLAQVILEEARTPENGLPLDVLREIIRASDRVTRDFLQWTVTTALEQSRRMHDIWRQQIAQGVTAPWARNLPWSGAGFWPWNDEQAPTSPAPPPDDARAQEPAAAPEGHAEAAASGAGVPERRRIVEELEELRRRLADLETLVAQRRGARRSPRAR